MSADIADVLARFNAVFNANDLDAVMDHFADGAIYLPGDGTEHRGKPAIRAAFAPQFAGRFGPMRFDIEDELIDPAARKATSRWICRHDLSAAHAMPRWQRLLLRARYGDRVGWRGVDVFHFDPAGLITGKFTYANYDRPQLRRALG